MAIPPSPDDHAPRPRAAGEALPMVLLALLALAAFGAGWFGDNLMGLIAAR